MTFSKFYTWLTVGTVSMVFTLGSYIWTNHTSAEAAALQETKISINIEAAERQKVAAEVKELRDIAVELKTIAKSQKEFNDWFIRYYLGGHRPPTQP